MTGPDLLRRAMLAAPASLSFVAGPQPSIAVAPDTWVRLIADLTGRTVWSLTQGMVWGFRPQADDLTAADFARRLYGYQSLVARQTRREADGGLRLRTKAWSFYLDRDSFLPIAELRNPYTGEIVACPPLSPPASNSIYGGPKPTAPWPELASRQLGEHAWLRAERISRFKPADTTWFKLEADFTTFACRLADLRARRAPHIPSTWSHSLVAEWQTWMRMHGQPGHILFQGAGAALGGAEAIPSALRSAIDLGFPGALAEVASW